MSLYKTYIYAKVQEAVDELKDPLKEPFEPALAPESAPVFSDEIMRKLDLYKDKAISVNDFESWMALLEKVATETGLNPATDFEKIASVLNRYRRDVNLEPL